VAANRTLIKGFKMARIKLILLAVAALAACTHQDEGGGRAETNGRIVAPPPLHPLSSSEPAQLAILRWHESLVDGRFDQFAQVQVRGTGESDELLRLWFEEIRRGVPPTIRALDMTRTSKLLGSDEWEFKTFVLVGCLTPSSGLPVRRMSVVNLKQIDGEWRVYGGDFGPPSKPFVGECPIQ
jgi:hypothetical protein